MTTRTRPDGVPLSSGQAGTEWAERQIEMENERLRKIAEGSTFFQHAQASANDEAGGRYARQNSATVVGASPISYPQLPAESPWAQPWPEGPDVYGVPIDEMEPVGEPFEIERAAEILRERGDPIAASSPAAVDCGGTSAAPTAPHPAEVETDVPLPSPTKSSTVSLASAKGELVDEAAKTSSPTSSQSSDVAFSVSAPRGTAAVQVTVPRNSFRRL
jgi:hypothetical protein